MKLILDFFPILLFFVSYKLSDIYTATAVLMAATTVQMALIYMRERSLQTMHKVTLVLVLGFGALTLGLHDERFIKWKPTVLYSAMALGLAFTTWGLKKSPIKGLLGSQLELPDAVWGRLNIAWVFYCAFMALTNAYVAENFTTEEWVNFKLWGYVFPVTFILGQGIYIARHMQKPPDEEATP
jgi:intracellular septation protein